VWHLSVGLLSSLLTLLAPTVDGIGQACLDNDAGDLARYFSRTEINVSLPDPISFSDEVSPEQAYFLFHGIFSKFKSFEFSPDPRLSSLAGRPGCILKVRWSFRNVKDDSPSLFLMMFYLVPEPREARPPSSPVGSAWKIMEIKAERL
jgi:hypothetical protein